MDQKRLETVFATIHLVYHRNKNQHGATAWWKWLSILRRSVLRLIHASQNKKICISISKYLHTHVIPSSYVAFSTVVADGQFSTLGTVLLAALAQTKKAIMPLTVPTRQEDHRTDSSAISSSLAVLGYGDTENDLGTPISRNIEPSTKPPDSQSISKQRVVQSNTAENLRTEKSRNIPPQKIAAKVKKSKVKTKKSANAIDDIFGALK